MFLFVPSYPSAKYSHNMCQKNKAGRVCDLLFDSKAASESIGATDTVISERTCLKKKWKKYSATPK